MDITRVCSQVYPFIGTFKWNYIIIQLPQDWMAPDKVRLPECCRPTRALGYANADSGKLVNWTTGACGWLVSRRSIYQQLCETTLQDVYIISLPHLYLLQRWVGYVSEMTRSGPHAIPSFSWLCLFQDTRTLGISILFNIHHPDDLYDVSPSTAANLMGGPPSCMWHSGKKRERASGHSGWPYGYWIANVFCIS